jgi:hypothetical protein
VSLYTQAFVYQCWRGIRRSREKNMRAKYVSIPEEAILGMIISYQFIPNLQIKEK